MLFDGDLVGAFGGLSITQTRRRSVDTSFAGARLVYFHLQQRLRQSLAIGHHHPPRWRPAGVAGAGLGYVEKDQLLTSSLKSSAVRARSILRKYSRHTGL